MTNTVKVTLAGYKRHLRAGAAPGPLSRKDEDNDDEDDDDDDDDPHGYPAYSRHDKIPPWWGNVSNDEGGNVPGSKTDHIIFQLRNEFSN